MNNNYKNKILVLTILTIVFTIMGSTLAFWNWNTSEAQKTLIGFTVEQNLSCAGDGGGNITSSEKNIVPTSCTNETYAIQRTITLNTSSTISTNDIFLDLWLEVENLGTGLSNSQNFKYAITKQANDCVTDPVASGTFNGLSSGSIIPLITQNKYIGDKQDTYYLYIWLDSAETSTDTMNQSFEFSLNGRCSDDSITTPSAPVLDENGMIPVVIDNSGNVTTVSEDDSSWYNYGAHKWANAILVNETSRSRYLNKPGTPVTSSDILAYYVWIPRYKYKIPQEYITCQEADQALTNSIFPSTLVYPECYEIVLDNELKEIFAQQLYLTLQDAGVTAYTIEKARIDLENSLKFSSFKVDELPEYRDYNLGMYFLENNIMTQEEILDSIVLHPERSVPIAKGQKRVDVVFESSKTSKENGDAENSYLTHPAFTFGNKELDGIWVGKFETTGNTTQPTVLNGLSPIKAESIDELYTTSLKFAGGTFNTANRTVSFSNSSTYGLSNTTDSHMMKNSEWGAVAYLSYSKYGTFYDGEYIKISSNSPAQGTGQTTTGCGSSYNCSDGFGSGSESYSQSTTQNITGIFDMAGGAHEYVMSINNNFTNNGDAWNLSNLPPTKYYNQYTIISNSKKCTPETCGHALEEVWSSNLLYMFAQPEVYFNRWLVRGIGDTQVDGNIQYWQKHEGYLSTATFRSVLVAQ